MKRILLSATLIAIILIGGTGCMFDNKPKQDVNEMALGFLEQKYGEKFEYSAPVGASYTGTRSFLVTCESFGDRKVLVQIEDYKDEEKRVVLDNYIAIKYEEQVKEALIQIANEEFGTSKVFFAASGCVLSEDLLPDASFEEYLACKDGMMSAVISLPESGYKDSRQFTVMSDKISDKFSCDELSILIIVVDDDIFETAEEDKLREIFLFRSGIAYSRINRYNGETKLEIFSEE